MEYTDVVFSWKASRQLQKQEAIDTGKAGAEDRTLKVPLADLSLEQRQALVPVCSISPQRQALWVDLTDRKEWYEDATPFSPSLCWRTKKIYLDEVLEVKDAIEMAIDFVNGDRTIEENANVRHESYQAEKAAKDAAEKAAYDAVKEELELLLSDDDSEALQSFSLEGKGLAPYARGNFATKIKDRLRALEREAAEEPMRLWIAAHGSPRLQKALAAGADVERPYIEERLRVELPGFQVDWTNDAVLDAGYPSEDLLDEAEVWRGKGHDADARILESWPEAGGYDPYGGYGSNSSVEAIVIWRVFGSEYPAIKAYD